MARSALLQVIGEYVSEILAPRPMEPKEAEQLDQERMRPLESARVRTISQMDQGAVSLSEASYERKSPVDKRVMIITMLIAGLIFSVVIGAVSGSRYGTERAVLASRAKEYQVTSTALKLFNRMFPDEVTEQMWLSKNGSEHFSDMLLQQAKTNPDLRHYLYKLGTDTYLESRGDALLPAETEAKIPLLFQWDERWGYTEYGNDYLGISGDGPTVLSMLVVGLTDNENATPNSVIDLVYSDELIVNGVTDPEIITWGGMKYGVWADPIYATESAILDNLEEGYVITLYLGPSAFYPDNHFVIIVDHNSEGYRIYDPMSRANSEKNWSYAEFSGAIREIWRCTWGVW